MKIDEKVLTYFESCNSPVDKEGYLYKKVRRPGSGLQGTWLMYCFEKQTERVVRLSKVNKLRGDFFKTVFKFSFQNLCDISPPTGLPVSSNQLCKKLSTQGVCTAVSKTQLSHTHTQGEIKTSYQKRWFVLKGNLLFYKDRQTDRDLVGVIVLEGCTVQLCESEENFAFSLVWSEPGLRTYKFAAENQASQESWIKALLSASHSYLALLVVDMESKYRGEGRKMERVYLCWGEGGLKRAAFVLEGSCERRCITVYIRHLVHCGTYCTHARTRTHTYTHILWSRSISRIIMITTDVLSINRVVMRAQFISTKFLLLIFVIDRSAFVLKIGHKFLIATTKSISCHIQTRLIKTKLKCSHRFGGVLLKNWLKWRLVSPVK